MPFADIRSYQGPFRLTTRNGGVTTFSELAEMAAFLRACGIVLSTDPVDGAWCAFDADDDLVPHHAVCPESRYGLAGRSNHRRDRQRQVAIVRGLPVPGTGRPSHGSWGRRPRHIAVVRQSTVGPIDADEAAGTNRIKPLRPGSRPPSDHDDLPTARRGHNWKLHRRTRWRIGAGTHL